MKQESGEEVADAINEEMWIKRRSEIGRERGCREKAYRANDTSSLFLHSRQICKYSA
jgi:hypothetical protein